MLAGYQFQFRPVLTIVVGICMTILVWLGVWQVQRLSWKQDLVQKIEARIDAPAILLADAAERWRAGEDMEYTPVKVQGRFDHHHAAHIFGTLDGVAGQYIFSPLMVGGGDQQTAGIVYVNRGFAPQSVVDGLAETAALPNKILSVEGLFRTAEHRTGMAKVFRPEDMPEKNQFYTRDPMLFAANSGLSASPFYIDSFAVAGTNWPKGGTTRLSFRNNHLDYALTWFGLAGVLLAVWLVLLVQKSEQNK